MVRIRGFNLYETRCLKFTPDNLLRFLTAIHIDELILYVRM